MAEASELREAMNMQSWSDNELVHVLAQRIVEDSAILQLNTDSIEEGMKIGFSELLHKPVEGELPVEYQEDPMRLACLEEIRHRIAQQMTQNGAIRG